MVRVLIIDDEIGARRDLRSLLTAHPEVVVMGEAALINDAIALLRRDDYDLVFLDIQLLGGNGFDLAPEVRPGARIIFVTAFDQFAFRAFEVNALDYLRKPLRVARLAEAIKRIVAAAPVSGEPTAVASLPRLAVTDVVTVKTGPGTMRFVAVADIVAIASSDNYSELHLAGGKPLLVRESLAGWEERLPVTHFLRVHRQTILNVARVLGFEHDTAEITLLRVSGLAEPVRARRQHWSELRTRLAALGRVF